MARLFGTDGVRGVANIELDGRLAYLLGKYGARVLRSKHQAGNNAVLIGHDGRISADLLVAALSAGFCSEGLDVYLADELPTPGIACLTRLNDFSLGVVVSASHNSFQFNGIKFFDHQGFKLPDSVEDEIASFIDGSTADKQEPLSGEKLGRIHRYENAVESYIEYLTGEIKPRANGLKVAVDCANGATQRLAADLFSRVGCTVIAKLGCEGNGININASCGSTHPEALARTVVEVGADIGFAFDGDGDRLISVHGNGSIINGDQMMAILARSMKKSARLKSLTLVATVMSNLGLRKFCQNNEINLLTTQVGDRYVLEEMLNGDYSLGGEQSGHIILKDHQTTGDGLLSALALLEAIDVLGGLDKALTDFKLFPQYNTQVNLDNQIKYAAAEDSELLACKETWSKRLADSGRIVLRASGTEPIVRIMAEAETLELAREICEELASILRKRYIG